MATPPSVNPIYHDPTQTRSRRSSSRKSFASTLSRSSSQLDSPRTACPKDGDAFSYDPAHLRIWYLPQELWHRLPAQLQSTLAAVQHSGAAVLTGFGRLDKHTEDLDSDHLDHKVDELLVHLDDLPLPKLRTISNASSLFQSDFSSPFTAGSSGSQSGCTSPVTSTGFTLSQPMCPASPISLGPPELSDKRKPSRDRSFSIPLEPHDAYYVTELSHLRTEALPRLRHKCHKVDTEWYETKRTGSLAADDVNAFENWWAEKKCIVLSLNEKGKSLATAHGLPNTGMGWQP
ncbi:uncharacterized protein K460DRAFT_352463 [Cucurbitaria berberidis CBS 394.84]|uniref:Uncharacterized protein n=1 Tax=Cucurbitaria berberidis CBS 394.84 TaxID=1168544 RepID=A0A9P4LAL1_9PLEO|nr:uncharacterized protein K460DRAFT_352463 [Cucurbitaria berberidis CBS 394.84]KAF1847309.1 hypothetical protein K460DRAFT_352463 [Cucurbitaria berberidis CBS 394.84]